MNPVLRNPLVVEVSRADLGRRKVEIRDDGCGLRVDRRAGGGLASMRERAAELGGTCLIESVPTGGTRVVAILPLPALTPSAVENEPSPELTVGPMA